MEDNNGLHPSGYYKSIQSVIARDRAALQSVPAAKRRLLVLFGLPMAWFFVNYYMDAPRGFHMALFWPAFLFVGLWYFKAEIRRIDLPVILSGLAVFCGAVHAALYASDPLSGINFLALPILSVFTLLLATGSHSAFTLRPFFSTLDSLLIAPFRSLVFIPSFIRDPNKAVRTSPSFHQTLKEGLTGLFVAAPLLFVLLLLLMRADAGFADSLGGFFSRLLADFRLTETMGRLIVTLIALVYFLSVIIAIRLNSTLPALEIRPQKNQSATVSLILLWSVNALYAVFTLTQLRTLYFPSTELTALNQNIAQYARSGFFSLLVVLAINLLLLWYLSSFTKTTVMQARSLKAGYLLMILFTANMIASSFYKMSLYEAEFGYTHLRLLVKFALVFFSLGLVILTLYLTGRLRDVLKPLTMLALLLFMALSLLNLDGLIAAKASDIYRLRGRLDTEYLSRLSADALPAMSRSFDFEGTSDPRVIALKDRYTHNLYTGLDQMHLKDRPLAYTLSELRLAR